MKFFPPFSYKKHHYIAQLLIIILCLVYLFQSWIINTDLSSGRHILFMDEIITLDGVLGIYEAPTFKKKVYYIVDGNDHRYGRDLWNILAFFSYIPYKVFGHQGLIVSNRMALSVFQLLAYLLLIFNFIRNGWVRLLALSFMILLPTSLYYQHMPKPEPIQLFFISLALIYFKKNKDVLSLFFTGLALGTKISFLPGALLLLLGQYLKVNLKKLVFRLIILFLGFGLAVPILFIGHFQQYAEATFLNTGHGSDDININVFTWISYVYNSYLHSNILISFFFLFILTYSIYISTRDYLIRKKNTFRDVILEKEFVFHILLSLSFLLPVFIFMKRLWDHYLHVGFVLLILVAFEVLEHIKFKHHKRVLILFGLVLVLSLNDFVKLSMETTKKLSSRTQTPEYLKKEKIYNSMLSFLGNQTNPKQSNVCIDPNMFYPKKWRRNSFQPFWGAFKFEDRDCRFVFMFETHLTEVFSEASASFQEFEVFRKDYQKFVVTEKSECKSNKCFIRIRREDFTKEVIVLERVERGTN